MVAKRSTALTRELQEYLTVEKYGRALRHPLVFMFPYSEKMNETLNLWLVQKSQRLEQAIEERDWCLALMLHEKYARLAAFQKLAPNMTDQEYWQYLGQTWIEIENLWQYREQFPSLLAPHSRDKEHRHLMMGEDEREVFDSLPETVTIYRGCGPANEPGWSWTLSEDQADWFAERFPERNGGIVIVGECQCSDIIAYLDGRSEQEILIAPKDVRIVQHIEVTADATGGDDEM